MGSKNDVKVYDYRYALDYALCHGPIDSLNYVWINEKRVFCGSVQERRDLCIDMQDLFGGDTKEGGVDGVIECYMGTDDATASIHLARRMGYDETGDLDDLTPEQQEKHYLRAPGSPGIAHLFFRRVGTDRGGFRWITNNYYLPAMKASVTRLPRKLGYKWSAIRPLNAIYDLGEVPDLQDPDNYLGSLSIVNDDPSLLQWVPGPIGGTASNIGYAIFGIASRVRSKGGTRLPVQETEGICDINYRADGFLSSIVTRPLRGNVPMLATAIPVESLNTGRCRLVLTFKNEFAGIGWGGDTIAKGDTSVYSQIAVSQWTEVVDSEGNKTVGEMIGQPQVSSSNSALGSASFQLYPNCRYVQIFGAGVAGWVYNNVSFSFIDSAIWFPTTERIHCELEENLGELPDANPAHDAYEIFVDEAERENTAMENYIDKDSFLACAKTLFEEGMGISYKQDQEMDRKSLLSQIATHAKCCFYQSPVTGKWTMKLLRDDYNPLTLPILTKTDCKIKTGKRRAWSQCVSEIIVEYTDPQEEGAATVTSHNDAASAIANNRVPKTNSYPFFRNSAIAQKVADRDVMEESYPLWSGTLAVSRKHWRITPGSVHRLQYVDPDYQIENMIVRVLTVDYGDVGSQTISLEVVEDIYAVAQTAYRAPQSPAEVETRLPGRTVAPQFMIPMSLNFPQITAKGLDEEASDENYPDHYRTVMVGSTDFRLSGVEILYRDTMAQVQTLVGIVDATNVVRTTSALPWEVYSYVPLSMIEAVSEGDFSPGRFYLLSKDTDSTSSAWNGGIELETEIIQLVDYDQEQGWRVKRGCFDTVPRDWPLGSILWDLESGLDSVIKFTYQPSDYFQSFWGLTKSGLNKTSELQAWKLMLNSKIRSILPHRPANVKVNDIGPGPLIDTDPNTTMTDLVVTWNSRNRLFEDNTVPAWDDPNQIAEEDTTYRVIVRHPEDKTRILYEEGGITTLTHTMPISALAPRGVGLVEVWAERENPDDPLTPFRSIMASQNYVQVDKVALEYQGWNYLWGRDWGGTGAA